MMSKVRDILGVDKESEFLQSFVRSGLGGDNDENEHYKSIYMSSKAPIVSKQSFDIRSDSSDKSPIRSKSSPIHGNRARRGRRREYFEEMYTDKDRAAAVSYGYFDIKQSLSMKRRQDRSEALQLPDKTDPGTLLALGRRECKNGRFDIAILFITKALELNPNDLNALVARSKCYLLIGDPVKALQDAETALSTEKFNTRAIYQKAEALYFLGQFEMSLMYFHRGLRLRPELNNFRLGVQKTQEAIEKTIAGPDKRRQKPHTSHTLPHIAKPKTGNGRRTKETIDIIESRKLLGEMCVDKEYLERLLKHPCLVRADTGTEEVSTIVCDAVRFLDIRQEFWRQQRSCSARSALLQANSITE